MTLASTTPTSERRSRSTDGTQGSLLDAVVSSYNEGFIDLYDLAMFCSALVPGWKVRVLDGERHATA